jgi:guanyl-specific ribonuclease Sa
MKRLLAGLAALLVCGVVSAFDLPQVTIHALPPEAQTTLRLIDAGGPFPYGRDGIMFGNRERILPTQARGYYREFTVPTPGVNHRGPRRIVTGGKPPVEFYYTADHYQSFQRIQR